jgi:hypothetical protein
MCLEEKAVIDFPQRKGKPAGGKCKRCYANHQLMIHGKERKQAYRAELTKEEKQQIVSLFTNGATSSELEKQFTTTRETIRKLLRASNTPLLTLEEKNKRWRNESWEKANASQLQKLETQTGKTLEERQKEAKKRARQARSFRVKEFYKALFADKSCVDCGEADLLVLQFDHREPDQKKCDVSCCKTIASMQKEAEKCDIVCSNCHTRRTQRMFGSWRLAYVQAAKATPVGTHPTD